ncbi:YpmS family protein [Bacillus pinisoli]|uniref:YpmS family protein n=1 Tax=Bacillus pinisoli TaxID=2901866 RepID=UPI001FF4CC54|nr:YpmS family protein [Bacillus pinisoli]
MRRTPDWKKAFFILLGTVLAMVLLIVGVAIRLLLAEPTLTSDPNENKDLGKPFFTLSTTKTAINKWIQEELDEEERTVQNINYTVSLEDYIYLRGHLVVFNSEIPFQMTFEPVVNETGGLTLQEREISLGRIQLPGDLVLGLLAEQVHFPSWVTVRPASHEIIVNVRDIELQKDMVLSVKDFDLEKDQLVFQLTR